MIFCWVSLWQAFCSLSFCWVAYAQFLHNVWHYTECHCAKSHYVQCHYAERRYGECHYAERHYAKLINAECYSAHCHMLIIFIMCLIMLNVIMFSVIKVSVIMAIVVAPETEICNLPPHPGLSRTLGQHPSKTSCCGSNKKLGTFFKCLGT
jgi:hypothetical protein